MRRLIVGVGVVVGALSFGIGRAASAATPAVRGCVGSTLSSLARASASPGAFGLVDFAQNSATPGLGQGIQNLQAGVVGNDVVPNTCNGS